MSHANTSQGCAPVSHSHVVSALCLGRYWAYFRNYHGQTSETLHFNFSPDSCSVVCPVGAIYCGTSGYACALEAAKKKKEADKKPEAEDEEAVEEDATDDEVTTEEAEARTTERSTSEEVDYSEDEEE